VFIFRADVHQKQITLSDLPLRFDVVKGCCVRAAADYRRVAPEVCVSSAECVLDLGLHFIFHFRPADHRHRTHLRLGRDVDRVLEHFNFVG
jgi:hypothetical protein